MAPTKKGMVRPLFIGYPFERLNPAGRIVTPRRDESPVLLNGQLRAPYFHNTSAQTRLPAYRSSRRTSLRCWQIAGTSALRAGL
jgi:hypothetical protein